jgi:hypothetical protein
MDGYSCKNTSWCISYYKLDKIFVRNVMYMHKVFTSEYENISLGNLDSIIWIDLLESVLILWVYYTLTINISGFWNYKTEYRHPEC